MTSIDSTLPRAPRHPDDEPPRRSPAAPGPLRAVADRWPLVLLVVVLFVGGGVYVGMTRALTYRAETEINVGRTDVRTQALPGYVAGAATLANAYSRVVESDEIVDRVARALDVTNETVSANLIAAPIPENPILRIIGRGESPDAAIRLTRTAGSELKRYVTRTDAFSKSLDDTLKRFREQSQRAASLRRKLNRLQAPGHGRDRRGGGRAQRRREKDKQRVAYDTAKLRADALGQMFRDRRVELASTAGIQVISRPALAGDDRRTVLQRLVAVGLVAGVLVGSALAMLLGARRRRRGRAA